MDAAKMYAVSLICDVFLVVVNFFLCLYLSFYQPVTRLTQWLLFTFSEK